MSAAGTRDIIRPMLVVDGERRGRPARQPHSRRVFESPSTNTVLYDEFCIIGPPHHCYRYDGLDALGIATVVTRMTNLADSGGFFHRDRSGSLWTDDDRQKVLSEFDVVK